MNDFKKIELANQMEAYYTRLPSTHSIVLSVIIRAGLIYESPDHFGVSHLIEHLLFRRLGHLEQRQLYYELECMGTTLRATTYTDCIRFYVEILPQFAEKTLQILEKLFHGGNWTAEDIRKEKKVVLNQINEKSCTFYDHSRHLYWGRSPAGHAIMGTASSVNHISSATIERYYERFFQPQNCAIVVSGNFSDDFEQFAQSMFSDLPNKSITKLAVEPILPDHFCQRTAKDDFIFDIQGEYADVRICFDVDPKSVSLESAQFLHSILGDGDGSRLSLLLREELGIVDEIYSEIEPHHGFCTLSISYDVTHDRLLESIELVYSVIRSLMHEITQLDINASVHFLASNWIFDLDSPSALNFFYGVHSFVQCEPMIHPEEQSNRFKQVTADELKTAAQRLFKRDNLSAYIYSRQGAVNHSEVKRLLSKERTQLGQKQASSSIHA